MVYKFFDKKTDISRIKSMSQNEQSAEELHKPFIRKFKKRKVYSSFKDDIWGADLADMQIISKFNKGFKFLLCVIDIFSIVNAFQSILKIHDRKLNKIWVDKGSEFYNHSLKKWLQNSDIEMYSTHNEANCCC